MHIRELKIAGRRKEQQVAPWHPRQQQAGAMRFANGIDCSFDDRANGRRYFLI